MKVSQLINESRIFIDKDDSRWGVQDIISKIPAKDKVVGVAGFANLKEMVLVNLDAYDKNLVSRVKLRAGEHIFRYYSHATMAGKMTPLIKVNVVSGLLYFLTDNAVENDLTEFETKGEKVKYLRLVQNSF